MASCKHIFNIGYPTVTYEIKMYHAPFICLDNHREIDMMTKNKNYKTNNILLCVI